MKRRVSGSVPQEQREGNKATPFQERLPWVAGYSLVLLVWLTSRFLQLAPNQISAEFTTLLIITVLMLPLMPWIRIPPLLALFSVFGGIALGMILLRLEGSNIPHSAFSFLQALVILVIAILPLSWSRITSIMTFLLLTGASLADTQGNMLLWRGALLWFLGGMFALLITLSFYSRYIAPPFNQDKNTTSFLGFRLMLQNLFIELSRRRRIIRHSVSAPQSFTTIKAGDIVTYEAYSVFRGPRYFTAIGPGYTMLDTTWRIAEAYDVRDQQGFHPLNATTRDGIQIETNLITIFHIRRPETPPEPRLPYPYDRHAIRELKYAETVQQDGSERIVHPYAQVTPRAVEIAIEEFARRTLDELLSAGGADGQEQSPLVAIGTVVTEKLNAFFSNRGLTIARVIILPFELPKAVVDARLGLWKRKWEQPSKQRFAGRSVRKLSETAAKAELSVVQDVLNNLKMYRQAGEEQLGDALPGYDEIIEQVESVLVDATTEGLLRSLLPAEKKK